MASPTGSDFEEESDAESSDICSEGELESEESGSDSDNSSDETVASIWTRIYPSEPEGRCDVNFSVRHFGVRNMPSPESTPATYFFLFMTAEILRKIVMETGRYAEQFFRAVADLSPMSRARRWHNLDFNF